MGQRMEKRRAVILRNNDRRRPGTLRGRRGTDDDNRREFIFDGLPGDHELNVAVNDENDPPGFSFDVVALPVNEPLHVHVSAEAYDGHVTLSFAMGGETGYSYLSVFVEEHADSVPPRASLEAVKKSHMLRVVDGRVELHLSGEIIDRLVRVGRRTVSRAARKGKMSRK